MSTISNSGCSCERRDLDPEYERSDRLTRGERSAMPSEWSVILQVEDPMRVHRSDLHAVLSAWTEDAQCDAHRASNKPFHLRHAAPRGEHHIEVIVAILDDDLEPEPAAPASAVDRLLEGVYTHSPERAYAHGPLTLGRQKFVVAEHPDPTFGELIRLTAARSWSELASSRAAGAARVAFSSPTTFRRGQQFLPFADPWSIVESIERRWTTWAPADARLPASFLAKVARTHVSLTLVDADLQTRSHAYGESAPLLGFTGWIDVRLSSVADADAAPYEHALGALLALARFSGVGYATTRGFGVSDASSYGSSRAKLPPRGWELGVGAPSSRRPGRRPGRPAAT